MVSELVKVEHLLIGGKREPSISGETFETYNPANNEVIARVAEAGPEDVDRAVSAARMAFDAGTWPTMVASKRGRVLQQAAQLIRDRADELAHLETSNCGKTISDARSDVLTAAACFEYYAGAATRIMGETIPVSAPGLDFTLREPVGVCAQIIPWNYPIVMAAWKLGPALAAGCTVVLKPAEQTPLTALALGDILHEAGIPDGVVNVLPGFGHSTGESLINHPLIDKIAFTGSTEVGKVVMRAAAEGIKRVSLELGGKSPMIVFDDIDLPTVVDQAIYSVFGNAGQDCTARTRIFVQDTILEPFTEALIARIKRLRVGTPSDETAEIGALISPQQLARVEGYIDLATAEGAHVACGGVHPSAPELAAGNFLMPTVIDGVHNHMRVAQEEIFGPVAVVIPFGSESEAIALANDSVYGLSGTIWTRDIGRALRVVRGVRSGTLSVNSPSAIFLEAPFGGFKQSGMGRELGMKALDLYTEIKNVFIATD